MRIRKITSKEAWRLMGFSDEDYIKASKVCSDTNLYKQAGNSIVVNVIYSILKELMSAKDCIDRVKSGELYNLIIIDDELKDGSALNVTNQLKELKKFKVPVFVMLEQRKEHLKKYYLEDGFNDVIIKNNFTDEFEKITKNL